MIKIIIILLIIGGLISLIVNVILGAIGLLDMLIEKITELSLKHNIFFYLISLSGIFLFFKLHWIVVFLIWLALFVCIILYRKKMHDKQLKIEAEKMAIQQEKNNNLMWITANATDFLLKDSEDMFLNGVERIINSGIIRDEYLFTQDNMLYGRANAFLNYFDSDIYSEDVFCYSCEPSKIPNEFREYGTMITNKGIYTAYQYQLERKKYDEYTSYLPFEGLKSVEYIQTDSNSYNKIAWCQVGKDGGIKKGYLRIRFPIGESVYELCQNVIDSGWSCALFKNSIFQDMHELHDFKARLDEHDIFKKGVEIAATKEVLNEYDKAFDEVKNYMNGSRGGGYAAEYANNTIDRLRGNNVESTAQVLDEHGRQVKWGADRTVNDVEIQTKYYKNAQQSIAAVFKDEEAIYIRSDGSKKMMQIEVPRDQYEEAIKYMQKRIDSGQVPGIEPGENAYSYVRKGYFTYAQANNAAVACTIESLTIDTMSGIICAGNAVGISSLITFAQQIWRGKSLADATKNSIDVGTRVLGTSASIYLITMQMTKDKIANPFIKEYLANGELKGNATLSNPFYAVSYKVVDQIKNSSIARSQFGSKIGLSELTEKQFVKNAVAGIVCFGPDIYNALKGKISTEQLIKNTAITTAGLTGASIGNAILPGVGGIVGGVAGGYIAKRVADEVVEDDSIRMLKIFKEEFIESIFEANLSEDELQELIKQTVDNANFKNMLQDMCASSDSRTYAKTQVLNPIIRSILKRRKKIKSGMYVQGLEALYG